MAGDLLRLVGADDSAEQSVADAPEIEARHHPLRAAIDFAKLSRDGGYHKFFPSLHLAYDISKNLKARASWSTTYGRPDVIQLVPAASVNDTAQTVTIGNPDLKPQMAKQIELKLDYYFKNNGILAVRYDRLGLHLKTLH